MGTPHNADRPLRDRGARIRLAGGWFIAVALVSAAMVLLAVGVFPNGPASRPAGPALFTASFSGPNRLVTNEYAHNNPRDPAARRSPDWDVTSGSLFAHDGAGWTGIPDAREPDSFSRNGTGSSVFRMTTRRHDFADAVVSLRLRNLGVTGHGRQPPSPIDGVHVFLRWQNPAWLYVVSLNRRDGQVVVKKKSPERGGVPEAGEEAGRYVTLGRTPDLVPHNEWQDWSVRITTTRAGTVVIRVDRSGQRLLSVSDHGRDGPAIARPGAVGLRGDNCEFEFSDFRVDHPPRS